MNKVYCRYCGKQIDEDATFCTYCGKEQNVSKASVWSTSELGGISKSIGHKIFSFIRVPYDYAKTLRIPRMSSEKVSLWRKRLKQAGKVLLGLSLVALLVAAGVWGYSYYYDEYLPEKRLKEASSDILNKMHSNNKIESLEYCRKILLTRWAFVESDETWGYSDVENEKITDRMQNYRKEAFRMIENEAYNGRADAQYLLGQLYIGHIAQFFKNHKEAFYDREYAVEPDTIKAIYWWNEAATQYYIPAYNKMGWAYEFGHGGLTKNIKKAVDFYKKGAEEGHATAQANYGRMFRDGVRIKVGSHKETKRHIGSYGYQGTKIQEYYDNNIHEYIVISQVEVDDYEWLIPKDIEKARYWWEKAAAQGNEYAKKLLQKVYE